MPLAMNREVFVTCAVTGSGQTQARSPHVPRSPRAIAESAVRAARAGAAVVHLHVRDPETGAPARDPALYREAVDRIREAEVDVVVNLTAGMGGDLFLGPPGRPLPPGGRTDMASAEERCAHLLLCRPEIATLDCGTMNFAESDYVMVNAPGMLAAMAGIMGREGIRPEIEAFDTGHLWHATRMAEEGVLTGPQLVQLCMGVPWGAPDDLRTFLAMVDAVPPGWTFSAFGLGRHQMAYVAASVLAGGNVRVGLEDNLWMGKGELATNEGLVERAVGIVEGLGARVIGPGEVRERLGLVRRAPL